MIDFIADVHGHAEKLIELLEKMNYTLKDGVYSHLNRKVLFIGDYIDRGPQIRETLKIVRKMVESGDAIALMGNHEYNALCFHYEKPEGGHLRPHSIKNIIQHSDTIHQFQNKQDEYENYLEWFKNLPLYYETDDFRAVHACWYNSNIGFLSTTLTKDRLTESLIRQSDIKGTELYRTIDETLKGREILISNGFFFKDKDGTVRKEIRIKWWEDPQQCTYKNISVIDLENLPDQPVDLSLLNSSTYYSKDEKPIFFGHYWLNGPPSLIRENVCCLDCSVAKKGPLVAYRYDGEKTLSNEKFIFV